MKNIINTILMASLSAAMTACIGNYEEINYDHYGPGSGDVLADDYALGSAMNNLAGCVISPDVNTAQFTDCLLGGTMGRDNLYIDLLLYDTPAFMEQASSLLGQYSYPFYLAEFRPESRLVALANVG
mgnify:CR=1 FL=1